MTPLATNIPIKLFSDHYTCNMFLGLYTDSLQPAIVLRTDEGEPFAKATVAVPEEYLMGFRAGTFAVKTWSENEGLWEQLSQLSGVDGNPLFARTNYPRTQTPASITTGFVLSPLWELRGLALEAYQRALKESLHG